MSLKNILKMVRELHSNKLAITNGNIFLTYEQLNQKIKLCQRQFNFENKVLLIQVKCRIKAIILMLSAIEKEIVFIPVDFDRNEDFIHGIKSKFFNLVIVRDMNLVTGNLDTQILENQLELNTENLSGTMSIMFTSGTTGIPKGVLISSSAILNLLYKPEFIQLESNDIFATYSSLSFDASIFEILTPLLNGLSLVILNKFDVLDSNLLKNKIRKYNITCLWMTASLFNKQIKTENYEGLTHLKKLIVGGDRVDFEAATTFLRKKNIGQLFNGYGPTENTVFTTVAHLTLELLIKKKKVPIGTMISGIEFTICDSANNEICKNSRGKLMLKGKGLFNGYIKDNEANLNAFVKFESGEIYYNTGDYVQFDESDDLFYFCGREDRQVKLNGYRIELDDIEFRLNRLENILNSVCLMIDNALVIVVQPKKSPITIESIRKLIHSVLNYYELPKHLLLTSYWPLTPNNKLDLKQIEIWAKKEISNSFQVLLGKNNALISCAEKILNQNIKSNEIGLFEIGFDSISISQFFIEIKKEFDVDIDIIDIYTAATLKGIEKLILEKKSFKNH